METTEEQRQAPRGRPRDPEREHRVLVAAIEEYSERGWAGLTMDGVARRAGVGKSTIYLRWSNKEDLIAAAVQRLGEKMVPLDTGSLEGDLRRLSETLYDSYRTTVGWGLVRILIDSAGSGDGVSELRAVNERHRRSAIAILERGVERGELKREPPAQLIVNGLYGTFIVYRMMQPWDELEGLDPGRDELVETVVSFLMNGLEPFLNDEAAD